MKSLMFYYLFVKVIVKAVSTAYDYFFGASQLSPVVYIINAVLVAMGIYLVVLYMSGKPVKLLFARYFFLDAVVIAFNLMFIRFSSIIDVTVLDTIVAGTLFEFAVDILFASATFVIARRKYIDTTKTMAKAAEPQPEQREAVNQQEKRGINPAFLIVLDIIGLSQ